MPTTTKVLPAHYGAAVPIVLAAAGAGLDWVWIEATDGRLVLHGTDRSAYVRASMPIVEGDDGWRAVITEDRGRLRQVATDARKLKADPIMSGDRVRFTLTEAELRVELNDSAGQADFSFGLSDTPWRAPEKVAAMIDQAETERPPTTGWNGRTATLLKTLSDAAGGRPVTVDHTDVGGIVRLDLADDLQVLSIVPIAAEPRPAG